MNQKKKNLGQQSSQNQGKNQIKKRREDKRDNENNNAEISQDQISEDQLTMIVETTKTPDRDQIFARRNPSPSLSHAAYAESWSGDEEDRVKGDRDWRTDAAEEIRGADHLTEAFDAEYGGHTGATATDPGALEIDPAQLEDEELHTMADNLGIPDHRGMTRRQLVSHIREASAI